MYSLFYTIYDIVWFWVVYLCCYWGVDLFFREYSQALKIIANIDTDHFGYNLEYGPKERHDSLFWSSVPLSFFVLSINPVIHSIIYMCFMSMVSVVDLNRVFFYILMFKIAYRINFFSAGCDFKPHKRQVDFLLSLQLLFIVVGYTDGDVVLPTLFQLLDEVSGVDTTVVGAMMGAHTKLFKCDTWILQKLLGVKIWFEKNRKRVFGIKLFLMVLIFISHIVYVATLTHPMEIAFCYYSAARVVQIYVGDLRDKKA